MPNPRESSIDQTRKTTIEINMSATKPPAAPLANRLYTDRGDVEALGGEKSGEKDPRADGVNEGANQRELLEHRNASFLRFCRLSV